ncbi:hypothetical protein FA13DRAFT_1734589 [Coprinellus micaceus]|uniref:Secreted protein n=1 Tax=Coprinellus micaceus TaxID=71717 RepID=A0A4Y7T5W2_COPMI|nr:hypothetical protein FA13DRAFT_1734589 [Coprinellus micaceus]
MRLAIFLAISCLLMKGVALPIPPQHESDIHPRVLKWCYRRRADANNAHEGEEAKVAGGGSQPNTDSCPY